MNKLTIKLKQHTPIIHFQHHQAGATLRASEVKPRLDRFILERLGGDYKKGIEKADKNGWLIEKGKGALNYKMRIECCGEKSTYIPFSNLSEVKKDKNTRCDYNSNNPNESKYEKLSTAVIYDTVKLTIICFDEKLKIEIENLIQLFFLLNNFGTRNNKGFGSFVPYIKEKKGDKEIERLWTDDEIIKQLTNESSITGVFRVENNETFENKLRRITQDYGLMKRGKSFGGYEKSLLWNYLCNSKDINWEKRKIKETIKRENRKLFDSLKYDTKKSNENRIETCQDININFFYIRALLGLHQQIEFRKFGNEKLVVQIEDALLKNNDEKLKQKAIDRFPSPITFKITDHSIIVITKKISKELYQYKNKNGKVEKRKFDFSTKGINTFDLEIPSNFDVADFVSYTKKFGNNLKPKEQ